MNLPQGSPTNGATKVLASGQLDGFDGGSWHHLTVSFSGNQITPSVDGTALTTVTDSTYSHGQTGLAVDSYATTQFDNYRAAGI